MPSLPIEVLPPEARQACERLRDALLELLGPDLVALWAYGAATFPDRPLVLGDVDTHEFLARLPDQATGVAIDALQDAIAADLGIEWDSWYLLARDATGEWSPRHVLRENTFDGAWALYRAHWLAGQYVNLVGADPTDVVRPPSWEEQEDGLARELRFIEDLLAEGRDDEGHAAYAVLMDAGSYGAWRPAMLSSRRLPRPSGRWMRSTLVGVPRSAQRCAYTMTPRPPRTPRS